MLELKRISKSFPGVKALDDVSIAFAAGEIHALVGENGAGKSTLMKIISGLYQPDAGEVLLDGKPIRFHNYQDGLAAGIDIVYQEIQTVPESTVAESIMIDKLITRCGRIDWSAVEAEAQTYMDMVQLDVPPDALMKGLSAAQKRLSQIARALSVNARMILLDEPTGALTEHEAENLFGILKDLKSRGACLVFVSHKFEEVFSLCDRASVLRDGCYVGTHAIEDLTRNELIQMMIGREYTEAHMGRVSCNPDTVVLKAEDVTESGRIHDASFELREGEILGWYGLVGAGRSELARTLIGESTMERGQVWIRGEKARIRSVGESLYRYRLGYITENRKEEGLFLQDTVQSNISITVWPRLRNWFCRICPRKEEAIARRMVDAMNIRTPGLYQVVENLSGGNQQKISVAKWLAVNCDVLIVDEPTVGVDVGAKDQIHALIRNLAQNERKSIILISSDMPEVIKLANRILVFRDKRIVGEVDDVDNPEKGYDHYSMAIGHHLQ